MSVHERPVKNVLKTNDKLLAMLRAERITFDEYASNVVLNLVAVEPSGLEESIAVIPDDLLEAFVDWARAYLLPVDFKPYPSAFLLDCEDPAEEEATTAELRPRYVSLWQALSARLESFN